MNRPGRQNRRAATDPESPRASGASASGSPGSRQQQHAHDPDPVGQPLGLDGDHDGPDRHVHTVLRPQDHVRATGKPGSTRSRARRRRRVSRGRSVPPARVLPRRQPPARVGGPRGPEAAQGSPAPALDLVPVAVLIAAAVTTERSQDRAVPRSPQRDVNPCWIAVRAARVRPPRLISRTARAIEKRRSRPSSARIPG